MIVFLLDMTYRVLVDVEDCGIETTCTLAGDLSAHYTCRSDAGVRHHEQEGAQIYNGE